MGYIIASQDFQAPCHLERLSAIALKYRVKAKKYIPGTDTVSVQYVAHCHNN